VEGAFTGALKRGKLGKFELANKGVIFLDEIGDMSPAMQAKLLRVLQDKEIERVGAEKVIPIDVRVISATNRDLHSMALDGSFRADLYYRLNVINIHIPALRDRKDDIPELIQFFVGVLNQKLNRDTIELSPEVIHLMTHYDWPGNIRELINVLEASLNFCRDRVLSVKDLPYFFRSNCANKSKSNNFKNSMETAQKSKIVAALELCKGNRKAAALALNISKSTLYRFMKKYELLEG
jgi:transcriptional regulator with PAS, ATPase and Fis domain